LLSSTLVVLIVKPLPALALGVPLAAIAGRHPAEFVLAVQYLELAPHEPS
jgi:hypothetical protein